MLRQDNLHRPNLLFCPNYSEEPVKKYKVGPIMQEMSRQVGRAIADYDMLNEGDRVIVAVSGGKDSLSLLHLLRYRQSFAPIDFEILAVYVDTDLPGFPLDVLRQNVVDLDVPFLTEKNEPLLKGKAEDINCFWCAWNRRKTLFRLADRLGFNKIALGHHLDDIVETVLLNLFYRGEVGAMKPRQVLFDGRLTLIRPLAYIEETTVMRFVKEELKSQTAGYTCPRSDVTERMAIKKLLRELDAKNPQIKRNIFHAMKNVKSEYLLNPDLPSQDDAGQHSSH